MTELTDYQKSVLISLNFIGGVLCIGFGSIVFLAALGRILVLNITMAIAYVIYLIFILIKFKKIKKAILKK